MPRDVRRAAERFRTDRAGSTTWHSFSFGHHYDPANTSFGPVVAVNDERLEAGAGFEAHEHRGLVIVTYVVSGSLVHEGISAHELRGGQVGVFRTGAGATHAERSAGGPVRFVQTWLSTDDDAVSYDVADGPVQVGDWTFDVALADVEVAEGHVFVVGGEHDGDTVRLTSAGRVDLGDATALLVTERR